MINRIFIQHDIKMEAQYITLDCNVCKWHTITMTKKSVDVDKFGYTYLPCKEKDERLYKILINQL